MESGILDNACSRIVERMEGRREGRRKGKEGRNALTSSGGPLQSLRRGYEKCICPRSSMKKEMGVGYKNRGRQNIVRA